MHLVNIGEMVKRKRQWSQEQDACILTRGAADIMLQQDSATLGRQVARLSLQGQDCQLLYKQIFKDEIKPSQCLLEHCLETNQIFRESIGIAYQLWPMRNHN